MRHWEILRKRQQFTNEQHHSSFISTKHQLTINSFVQNAVIAIHDTWFNTVHNSNDKFKEDKVHNQKGLYLEINEIFWFLTIKIN